MIKELARGASTPTPSDFDHPEALGAWDLIQERVPVLPCGAVTLIVLYGDDPATSHAETVGDLVSTLLTTEERFAYVTVNDPRRDMADMVAAALNEEPSEGRVIAYVDRDHQVMARLGDGTGLAYACGVPSLDNVETFLGGDEHGDERLLILDGFERARPYPAEGPALIPVGVPMSADDIDAWRSADLRAFAESRPNAPTVVVWTSTAAQSAGAKRSVGDAAEVVVQYMAGDKNDLLSINVRSEHGCWEHHD